MATVDRKSNVPLYLQICDILRERIAQGQVGTAGRLPNERDLAKDLGVSRHTVVAAYRLLEREGVVQSQQGRGTFITQPPREVTSGRQGRVLRIIDLAFDAALESGFTPEQFLGMAQVRVCERRDQLRRLRVLFIDCNPEHLSTFTEQFRSQSLVQIDVLLLSELEARRKPNPVVEGADLIVTTTTHQDEVRARIGPNRDVLVVSTSPNMEAMIRLARIAGDTRVLLVSTSREFWDIFARSLQKAGLSSLTYECTTERNAAVLEEKMRQCSIVIVSADRSATVLPIAHAAGVAEVIRFRYEFDQASMDLVSRRILELREKA